MQDWTKVVTEPLGLGGFALFLVFGVLARAKRADERRWLAPMAMGMAVLALAGGLILAMLKTTGESARRANPAPATQAPAPTQVNQQVEQKTTGPGSPAVQGVQGDVTITVDQSGDTWKKKPVPQKAAEKTTP